MKKKIRILSVMLAILLLASLCACGSADSAVATEEVAYEDYAYSEGSGGWDGGYAAEEYAMDAVAPAEEPIAQTENPTDGDNGNYTANLKIIKTGNLNIETKTFEETDSYIRSLVEQYGGILAESSITGTAGSRWGSYTVRIPSESFDTFFYDITGGCTITYQSISSEDVTDQYTDLATRLETAQKKYARLLELLDECETLSDIYAIEYEISDVEYEIDSLTGTLNGLDSRISFSTIYISVDETPAVSVIPETTSFGASLLANLQNGTNNAILGLQDLILSIAYNWFSWLVFLALVIVAVLVIRRVRRRRRARRAAVEASAKPKEETETKKEDA